MIGVGRGSVTRVDNDPEVPPRMSRWSMSTVTLVPVSFAPPDVVAAPGYAAG
jgi:hypothetical protein